MKVYYEVVHDLGDFKNIMMVHMNEYSSIYIYTIYCLDTRE